MMKLLKPSTSSEAKQTEAGGSYDANESSIKTKAGLPACLPL
jgi:hypothetical protein